MAPCCQTRNASIPMGDFRIARLTFRRSGAQFGTNFLCNFTPENGRSEIVATTSVGDAVRASNSGGQSDVGADRHLYAPFNGHEPNSLVEGAQRGSTPRTRRLE